MAGWLAAGLLQAVLAGRAAGAPHASACQRVVLTGEVDAGHEWKAGFGQGWVFRVVPIEPGKAGYSGWDLVVDQERPAGYPDALLLATPPYNSINEREIGTTFGLRAQDAIGWNPRSFHFLTDPAALREGQKLFLALDRSRPEHGDPATAERTRKLMALEAKASAGEFRILDARLTPGMADAVPYAQNWAIQSARTPHTVVAPKGSAPSARGELEWMRFSITLWLPEGWKAPRGAQEGLGACEK